MTNSSPPTMAPPPQSPNQDTEYITQQHQQTHHSIRTTQPHGQSSGEGKPSVFSKERYRPLFDVQEKILFKRLFKSIMFCGGSFYGPDRSDPNNAPDLYGPFWICTTIVLVMGVLGTFTKNDGVLDIKRISYASLLFYIGWLLPSFVLYWFLRWFNAKRGMSNIMSLYGYSFFIYIPTAILTLIPIDYIDIITASIAAAVSTLFVVKNVYCYFIQENEHYSVFRDTEQQTVVQEQITSDGVSMMTTTTKTTTEESYDAPTIDGKKPNKKIGLILMLGVIGVHLLIALLAYLFFYRRVETTPTPTPTPDPPTPFVLTNFHRILGIGQ